MLGSWPNILDRYYNTFSETLKQSRDQPSMECKVNAMFPSGIKDT